MMYFKKNLSYLKHIMLMTFSNIPRLVLSVSGLFIGLLVLAVGSILMDTYYSELKSRAEEYSDFSIIANIRAENDCIENVIEKVGDDNVWRNKSGNLRETIYINLYTNNYRVALNADVIGTSPIVNNTVLMDYDKNTQMPIKAELISGRWIDGQDLASERNVIIIDDFTADLLFGTTECIGQVVELGKQEAGISIVNDSKEEKQKKTYKVVGVFKNEELTKDNRLQYKKFKRNGNSNIILETKVYIPITNYNNLYKEAEEETEYLVWQNKRSGIESVRSVLEKCELAYANEYDTFNIITKERIIKRLEKEILPIKLFMLVILAALFVISGINTMNIMFFSIKERMSEIGIKKAMGATNLDIILQFMMEGLVTSYIAGILAGFFSGVVSNIIGRYIENQLFISFNVSYSKDTLLLIFIVSSIYGVVFSFLPSYYGAESKVTDSLRFE